MELETAISIAQKAHEGQVDKNGNDYFSGHLQRVMDFVSDEAKVVAVLHDTIEDTSTTYEFLRQNGLTPEEEEALKLVTRTEEDKARGETYMEWMDRIGASGNKLAIEIKRADILDHTNPEAGFDFEGSKSLLKRDIKSLSRLTGEQFTDEVAPWASQVSAWMALPKSEKISFTDFVQGQSQEQGQEQPAEQAQEQEQQTQNQDPEKTAAKLTPADNILIDTGSKGSIKLKVDLPSGPDTVNFNGMDFIRKSEGHISLNLDFRSLGDKAAISEAFNQAASQIPLDASFDSSYYLVSADDGRRSIVQTAQVTGLDELFSQVEQQLGISIPRPFPHVTVYTYPKGMGIALPNEEAFSSSAQDVTQEFQSAMSGESSMKEAMIGKKVAEQEKLRRDEKANLLGKKKVKEANQGPNLEALKADLEREIPGVSTIDYPPHKPEDEKKGRGLWISAETRVNNDLINPYRDYTDISHYHPKLKEIAERNGYHVEWWDEWSLGLVDYVDASEDPNWKKDYGDPLKWSDFLEVVDDDAKDKATDKDLSMSDLKDHLRGDIEDMDKEIKHKQKEMKQDQDALDNFPDSTCKHAAKVDCHECAGTGKLPCKFFTWDNSETPANENPMCECGHTDLAHEDYSGDCGDCESELFRQSKDQNEAAEKTDYTTGIPYTEEVKEGKKKSGLVGKKVAHASVKLAHVQANPQYAQAFQSAENGKYVVTADTGNKDWGIGTLWELSEVDGEQVLSRVVEDTPEMTTQILANNTVGQKLAKTASIHHTAENTETVATNLPLGGTETENAIMDEGLLSGEYAPEEKEAAKEEVSGFDQLFKALASKKPKEMSWTKFAEVLGDFLAEGTTKKASRPSMKEVAAQGVTAEDPWVFFGPGPMGPDKSFFTAQGFATPVLRVKDGVIEKFVPKGGGAPGYHYFMDGDLDTAKAKLEELASRLADTPENEVSGVYSAWGQGFDDVKSWEMSEQDRAESQEDQTRIVDI
jgi:hypothetical protein